jgi:hypothetical protein
MILNLKFFHGFGGLIKRIIIKLTQLSPLYVLVFIAYGDSFLPQPLSDASYNTRTTINNLLTSFSPDDILDNNKYDNKKRDKLIKEIEEKSISGEKNNYD